MAFNFYSIETRFMGSITHALASCHTVLLKPAWEPPEGSLNANGRACPAHLVRSVRPGVRGQVHTEQALLWKVRFGSQLGLKQVVSIVTLASYARCHLSLQSAFPVVRGFFEGWKYDVRCWKQFEIVLNVQDRRIWNNS